MILNKTDHCAPSHTNKNCNHFKEDTFLPEETKYVIITLLIKYFLTRQTPTLIPPPSELTYLVAREEPEPIWPIPLEKFGQASFYKTAV